MYNDYWFESDDGLKLYARDYPNSTSQATLLCIPGLTRNSADFEEFCEHFADRFRILAVDLRGRGRSAYDPNPHNYHPGVYLQDMISLLDSLALESVVLVGTSLGGLVSMLLTSWQSQRVAGVIINDIGPEVSQAGMDRIKAYVCNPTPVNNWREAVDKTREIHGSEYPDFNDRDWQAFTGRLYREDDQGCPQLNYDPAISVLLEQQNDKAPLPDLWPVFSALNKTPLLVLRGELSDLLSSDCITEMRRLKPDMDFCEVPRRGHTPLLTEPEAVRAIEHFLKEILVV